MKPKKILSLSTLFFLSRLFFLNPQPVFFDSPEYLSRLANPNLLQALASGHPPFHAGYILLCWPIFQIISLISLNPILAVEISTVFLGFLTIFFFYLLVKNLFSKKIAFWSAIIASLVPYFWIASVSIMIETPYISFFILSLYFFVLYLKKGKYLYLLLSAFSFGFSYFIHTIILAWLPAFLGCYLLASQGTLREWRLTTLPEWRQCPASPDAGNWRAKFLRKKGKFFTFFLSSILFFYLCNVFLLCYSQLFSLKEAFHFTAFGKLNEHLSFLPLRLFIPRLIRNWLILLLRANTNLLVIISFITLFLLFQKGKKRLFFALTFWIFPSIITNQWWDSVLLGRHAILASFPLALTIPLLFHTGCGILNTHREWPSARRSFSEGGKDSPCVKELASISILILYLLVTSLGALQLLKQPIPYIEQAKAVEKLPPDCLLLESHFARPWIKYKGEIIFINEPGWQEEKLVDLINQSIQSNIPVFATSQALSDPYGLYCGPYLNPLSLNPQGKPELEKIFDQYHFEKIATVNDKENLFIHQIKQKSTPEHFYQDFKIPYDSCQRIDFFDPLSQLWFLVRLKLYP